MTAYSVTYTTPGATAPDTTTIVLADGTPDSEVPAALAAALLEGTRPGGRARIDHYKAQRLIPPQDPAARRRFMTTYRW